MDDSGDGFWWDFLSMDDEDEKVFVGWRSWLCGSKQYEFVYCFFKLLFVFKKNNENMKRCFVP